MDYSVAFVEENRLFGELIRGADPALPVPTCPGWTVQQLFRHVGRGDRWAAQMVAERSEHAIDPRSVSGGKPPADPEQAIDWLHEGAQLVIDAVAETGPDSPIWTFIGPRPSAWWIRRRLHEATVHRADAALALGLPYELSPALAADGISEFLDLLAHPGSGRPSPLDAGATLHLHASEDTLGSAGEWSISHGDDAIIWDNSHTKAAAAVRGRAVDLLLALTRRQSAAEAGVEVLGDQPIWETWLERTAF
ncbi:maleylpyruvate isomerase family mycothiol-dependent enzyme [Nocardia sp. 348MFTsu5.1]|uniref:maleylpyruvate isomerase family mycothiol-dependent enzyme n=1 Tax=Nocardia sp. 348MFTsu5.1 TaxID=1172185 RepID=UPI000370CE11|nr:maleylpyruvate isomerase family mycothiol-dependent enzyme [Nocardia sp. 348MFTsu5.1]